MQFRGISRAGLTPLCTTFSTIIKADNKADNNADNSDVEDVSHAHHSSFSEAAAAAGKYGSSLKFFDVALMIRQVLSRVNIHCLNFCALNKIITRFYHVLVKLRGL